MSLPLVTGVAPRWDAATATLASSAAEVHLVRRCADVSELVGVAAAGLARVALVSSDLRGLDRSVVDRLGDAGVLVVALHPPGEQEAARRLRRWGLPCVLPADLTVAQLDEAVLELQLAGSAGERAGPAARGRGPAEAQPGGPAQAQAGDPVAGQPGGPPEGGAAGPAAPGAEGGAAGPAGETRAGGGPEVGDLPGHRSDPSLVGVRPEAGAATEEDLDRELRTLVEQELAQRDHPEGNDRTPPGPSGPTDQPDEPAAPRERGEVVVVWGAYGSPGRTTVAVNLAAELAGVLDPVVLVDADTYGASVAQALSVLDEAPGLAAVCRAADQGTLDELALDRHAPEVRPGLRVLTGLPRPDRWPEIRESALLDVLEQARAVARWVVVDVAPLVEQDEELSFDTAAPRRNGATLTALQAADRVVVVGAGDPLGLQRLVRALDALEEHSRSPRTVVVTRVRPGPVGPEPGRRIGEALQRFAGVGRVVLVPEDRESLDAAMLHGQALVEARPAGPARQAVARLAAEVAGHVPGRATGRATGRGGGRRLLPWRGGRGPAQR
ncbi:AAA family ATPase [Ornithinimicrobium flavum]|uniref:AAA family ATPase n=1 Tax=Ornithinimicrobium flavum TaxID=1288636 RepID=UPI00106F3960|nr:hypothetical protein [Ornithinimicrobium flavum]